MRDQDLSAAIEAAWGTFRGRLADHVAQMDDNDVLSVELSGDVVDEDDLGAAPCVQLCAYGGQLVRAEAVSNDYLHESFRLTDETERVLVDLGWEPPLDEPGWQNFHLALEMRDVDRLAVLVVRTLREVYGVVHPAFLDAEGLEVDPAVVVPRTTDGAEDVEHDPDEVATPRSREHLAEMVEAAIRVVLPDLTTDDQGDIAIRWGQSVAFVRTRTDRVTVEVFAELVLEPEDLERLAHELVLLNTTRPLWKFVHEDGVVLMRFELLATPFSAALLRNLVHRFLDEVDRTATELVGRVGGRRFCDPRPDAIEEPDSSSAVDDLSDDELFLEGLLELFELGRPRALTVAGLYSLDRLTIIRQIVGIRTGLLDCGDRDPDDVLHVLRKALRLVSDGKPEPVPLPPKPISVQASLLTDDDLGEESLDLGLPA